MSYGRAVALGASAAVLCLLGAMSASPALPRASATATTTTLFSTATGELEGEGGQYDQPWWDAIVASTPPSYGSDPVQFLSSPGMDQARQDLVTGLADFAVAQGPLTGPIPTAVADEVGVNPDEAGTASQNGLNVAYVPIALEAVAVPFVVIQPGGCSGTQGTISDPFGCTLLATMNMSPTTLETAFEGITSSWDTPAIQADNGGTGFSSILSSEIQGPYPATMTKADASNGALTSYFLGTTAQSTWDAWAGSYGAPADMALYSWPKKAPESAGNQFQESDMIADMIPRNPQSPDVADVMGSWAGGYNISALPWAWTFPAYTKYPNANLPDVSIENAAGGFVEPGYASMEAALSYASLGSSNMVTFGASTTDKTAYPAPMMTTEYLVVPLDGLPADKAATLAGLIGYLLSANGQSAICSAGYLPVLQSGLTSSSCPLPSVPAAAAALSSQILAGDNAVVAELNAEVGTSTTTTSTSSPSTSSTTTSSTTTSSTTTSSTTTTTTTTSTSTTTSTTTATVATSTTSTAPTSTTVVPPATTTTSTTAPTATSTTAPAATSITAPAATTTTAPATTTSVPPATTTGPTAASSTPAATTVPVATTSSNPPTDHRTKALAGSTTTTSEKPGSTTKTQPTSKTTSGRVLTTTTKALATTTTKRRTSMTTRARAPRTTTPKPRRTGRTSSRRPSRVAKTSGSSGAGGPPGSGGGPGSGGPRTLAMTGSGAFRVAGLGLGLLALGEASRQALRRRRAPKVGPRP